MRFDAIWTCIAQAIMHDKKREEFRIKVQVGD